jgi:putative FmdB family regulatory protein
MPTYEYRCPRGHAFEKFYQRIRSHPTAKCPTCGRQARRLISGGAGLVFKGSGFYITDYKRAAEKRGADKPEGGAPGAKPAESKPEAKPKKDAGGE